MKTMNTLADNPSKADELAHWREFLQTLPPCSYLALYLHGSDAILQQYMANDMSTELIPAIRRARDEALAEEGQALGAMRKAQDELRTVKAQVDALRRDVVKLRDELRRASESATTLARCAAVAHANAVGIVVDMAVAARGTR